MITKKKTTKKAMAVAVDLQTVVSHFNLAEHQKKYKDAIMWLLDEDANRATGRTYLVACVLIEIAMKYPDKEIPIYKYDNKQEVFYKICELVDKHKKVLGGTFTFRENSCSIIFNR